MDVLTHGFLPYAAATWLKRPHRERAAAAVGGFAPDVDVLWAWAAAYDPHLFPLVHRGFSHTLVGAPLLALAAFALLAMLGRGWTPFRRFEFAKPVLIALVLGALSHLALDMLTITGVPLLWPLGFDRYTAGLYFFSVWYMLLVALVLWIPVWRGRASDRWVKAGSLVLVGVLVAAGALRVAAYPFDAPEDAVVTPGPGEGTFLVSRRNDTGVLVWRVSAWSSDSSALFFPEPRRAEASAALDVCLAEVGAKAWRWSQWGLPVVNATVRPDGGWNLTLRDSARLYLDRDSGSAFFGLGRRAFGSEDRRAFSCTVDASGAVETARRGSFWG